MPPIDVTYLDLLEGKRGEGRLSAPGGFCAEDPEKWKASLNHIVEFVCLNLDANKVFIDNQNELTDEQRVNMTKMFKKEMLTFSVPLSCVCCMMRILMQMGGMYNTQYEAIEHPAAMLFIPGTRQDVNNLVKLGKSIAPHITDCSHGEEHTNRSAQDYVLDVIKNGGGEHTVIVSCGMGSRSFFKG